MATGPIVAAAVRHGVVAVALALLGAEAAVQMRGGGGLRAEAVVDLSRRAAAEALRAEAAVVSRRAADER